jgi:hypothetical protein
MNKIIIIRGLPGSGKTTLAKELAIKYGIHHHEADRYFTDSSGVYRFDPVQIGAAHSCCQRLVSRSLYQKGICIVANTFTTKREIDPYIEMADMYLIINCNGEWESVHAVPKATLEKMRNRWEYQPLGMEIDYWPPMSNEDFEEEILSKVDSFLNFEYSKNFLSINTY